MAERIKLDYFRHALSSSRLGIDLETRIENRRRLEHLTERGRSIIDRSNQRLSQNSIVNIKK